MYISDENSKESSFSEKRWITIPEINFKLRIQRYQLLAKYGDQTITKSATKRERGDD